MIDITILPEIYKSAFPFPYGKVDSCLEDSLRANPETCAKIYNIMN